MMKRINQARREGLRNKLRNVIAEDRTEIRRHNVSGSGRALSLDKWKVHRQSGNFSGYDVAFSFVS